MRTGAGLAAGLRGPLPRAKEPNRRRTSASLRRGVTLHDALLRLKYSLERKPFVIFSSFTVICQYSPPAQSIYRLA